MSGAMLVPEFDHEIANTRRMLERVPEEHFGWRPHDKSFTLRELAAHIANLLTWTGATFSVDEIDMAAGWESPNPQTMEEILSSFDENAAAARAALQGASAEKLGETWTLRTGDEVHFSMPKGAVYRFFVGNHLVHHRAQLGLYLRLLDVPVPGMYGPSADEPM